MANLVMGILRTEAMEEISPPSTGMALETIGAELAPEMTGTARSPEREASA